MVLCILEFAEIQSLGVDGESGPVGYVCQLQNVYLASETLPRPTIGLCSGIRWETSVPRPSVPILPPNPGYATANYHPNFPKHVGYPNVSYYYSTSTFCHAAPCLVCGGVMGQELGG